MDSDSDSPEDDQASADAGAATVNATDASETDNWEVYLVVQRKPLPALVHVAGSDFANRVGLFVT